MGAEEAESFAGDFHGIVEHGGVEDQGGDKGAFLRRFQKIVEVIAARPGAVFEFGEKTVEEPAGGLGGVDPLGRKGGAEGFAERFEMQAQQQEVALGGVIDARGGRRGSGAAAGRAAA